MSTAIENEGLLQLFNQLLSVFLLFQPLKHGGDLCGAKEPALEHEQPAFLPLSLLSLGVTQPWLTPGF